MATYSLSNLEMNLDLNSLKINVDHERPKPSFVPTKYKLRPAELHFIACS